MINKDKHGRIYDGNCPISLAAVEVDWATGKFYRVDDFGRRIPETGKPISTLLQKETHNDQNSHSS